MNDQNNTVQAFDAATGEQMRQTARWAGLLAGAGYAGMAVLLISSIYNVWNKSFAHEDAYISSYRFGGFLAEAIVVGLCFYPFYTLSRFARGIRSAIELRNQSRFNESLRYLKGVYRYMGIATVLLLAFFALGLFIFALN